MTMQWADDFSRYGLGAASEQPMRDNLPYNNWVSSSVADPDPLIVGGRCCRLKNGLNNNSCAENRIALPTPTADTVGIAGRFWFPSLPGSGFQRCVGLFMPLNPNSANYPDNIYASCRIETNGSVSIVGGLRGEYAPIANTGAPVVSTNAWNHFETAYNGTTGSIEVRLNGSTILTGVSPKTGTIYFANPINTIGGSLDNMFMKDLVIWDSSGATNNNFFGTVSCKRLKPNADTTLGGWVPSTGATGFNLLAKDAVNDATYLSAGDPPPAAMEYGFENLPPDITSVRAMIMMGRMRKVDGGDGNVQMAFVSNGDVGNGANRPLTTSSSYWYDVSQLDPDTGLPWSPLAVDNMTGRMNRTI